MKRCAILVLCLFICLSLLAGCACEHTWIDADCITARTCSACGETEGEPLGHTWVEADCVTAKTCSSCGAVDGEPLGHTIVQRQENPDVIAATVTQVEYCAVCNEQIASETVPLTTMLQDGMFLFTPNEFMERLAAFTDKYAHRFTYEFVLTETGLASFVYMDDRQAMLQFFGRDTAPLTVYELDTPNVWCVSLTEVGEEDAALRQCFLMACDPELDKNTVYRVDVGLTAAFQSAAYTGEPFAYLEYNELLYETTQIFGDVFDEEFFMEMTNVYASDFREEEKQETIIELNG